MWCGVLFFGQALFGQALFQFSRCSAENFGDLTVCDSAVVVQLVVFVDDPGLNRLKPGFGPRLEWLNSIMY